MGKGEVKGAMAIRKAKIICTIGPASCTKEVLFSLIRNGMDVARLNFSHGNRELHAKAIDLIHEGVERCGRSVAILQDLQGIKIRVGMIRGGSVLLRKGNEILVSPGSGIGDEERIYVSYPGIVRDARKGERILLDDGLIQLEVKAKGVKGLRTRIVEGGVLGNRKGVNLPFRVPVRAFTRKDETDLAFGLEMGVDYVALSFVRTTDDIRVVKNWLKRRNVTVPLIAKIEKSEALTNIEGILNEVEGIMIARGDLGVDISPEEVPVIQKRLIERSNAKGKLVITATQMLESMREHLRPTRAEAADVANAVIDGSDALMLSGETATGKYPLDSLKMMGRIIEYTEKEYPVAHSPFKVQDFRSAGFSEAVADAACRAAEDIKAKFIVAFTHSGFTAKLVSKFRPKTPIVALTPRNDVLKKMCIYWGVSPLLLRPFSGTDRMMLEVERSLLSEGLARKGDRIVITASTPVLGSGKTNLMKLHTLGEGARTLI
ncbi:MAG TPA: pyruvate kinase [Thermodesulfovibrionales bacterium]|nr:pyruvate kinase [Thermodesulfovibrionales bacterium]